MFGYVTVYKPELKIKEYEAYKGVYCTLCKEMGKEYGILSRFLLSYDGAFYVMYKLGLSGDNISVKNSRCTFNPCKKCMKISTESDAYKLASTITVVLAYFKLVDNLHDSSFFKKLLLYMIYPYFALLKNKAKKKYPEIFQTVEAGMQKQFEIEVQANPSPDKCADPTARMLAWLFSYGECDENKEKAEGFGYQLGRAVYFLDAFDDYKDDIKDNSFNPFRNTEDIVAEATVAVNLSAGALSEAFTNQQFKNFSPIIENVIFDGLNYQLNRITKKYRGETLEQSL